MDKSISLRMMSCNVICTFLVILRHSQNLRAFFISETPASWNAIVQNSCMNITSIAVPFFFLMSGFFFFKGVDVTYKDTISKIKRRCKTLLVPFLVWGAINTVILQVSDPSRYGLLDGLLFTHLWYVRDLLFFVLFTPFLAFLRNKATFLLCLVLVALAVLWQPVDNVFPSSEGMFFFTLGCAIRQNVLLKLTSHISLAFLVILWVVIPFVYPIGQTLVWQKVYIFSGVLLLWIFSQKMPIEITRLIKNIAPYCFFIYCAHLYVLKAMKVTLASMFRDNDAISLVCFFLIPIIVSVLLLSAGVFLKKHCHTTFALLTGFRNLQYLKKNESTIL